MNQELRDMFVADQMERNNHPDNGTPEYIQLRERDAQRRRRVSEMILEGLLIAPDDYFHAALIFQHGETLDDIWQAHELASKAAKMGATQSMGYKDSRWLATAALDRWLMYQDNHRNMALSLFPMASAGGCGTLTLPPPMMNAPPTMFPLCKSSYNRPNVLRKKCHNQGLIKRRFRHG